tara:strand:+ start:12462 stop:13022 length:561 start_codon:yes stop_codon:yes gene_type:complete
LYCSANASQLNFITIDEGARSEIQQALAQGLEVTVHQNPINVNGWQGSGYSVIDRETGVGAYLISGGANGGSLNLLDGVSFLLGALSTLTGGLDSIAAATKSVVPMLGNIDRALTAIKFFHEVMVTGTKCNGSGMQAVIIFMLLTALISQFAIAVASALNPLAGFVFGFLLDQFVNWLISTEGTCS